MTEGLPEPEDASPPPPPSLAERVARAGRARIAAAPAGDWRVGLGVALLLAAGPLLTIGGAAVLRADARAEARRLDATAAPRAAAARASAEARAALAPVLARPSIGQTLEALARALPEEARLARAERTAQGALEVDIAAPDPDAVRAALRRDPALAGLRDVTQRRGEGAMIATFRSGT